MTLLGDFAVARDGHAVRLPATAQRLLAFLCLQPRQIPRHRAAFTLWPDSTETHAFGSLRSALFKLRRSGCPLRADGDRLALGDGVDVDYRRAVGLAQALARGAQDPGELSDLDCFSRELLPDWYDEWLVPERREYHEVRVHTLELLAAAELKADRPGRAVDAARAAIHADYYREYAYRVLVAGHIAQGNHAQALEAKSRLQRLRRELGLEPAGGFDPYPEAGPS